MPLHFALRQAGDAGHTPLLSRRERLRYSDAPDTTGGHRIQSRDWRVTSDAVKDNFLA